jgi:hypothetical protein
MRKGGAQKSRKSRKNSKSSNPKTRPIKSHSRPERVKASKARSDMTITQLHFMARSLGIPFGGLDKMQLVKEINRYRL